MIFQYSTELCHPDPRYINVVENRRNRLKQLIELSAPEIVIIHEAELYLRSFKRRPLWRRLLDRMPHWMRYCVDKAYRSMWKATAIEASESELENENDK